MCDEEDYCECGEIDCYNETSYYCEEHSPEVVELKAKVKVLTEAMQELIDSCNEGGVHEIEVGSYTYTQFHILLHGKAR